MGIRGWFDKKNQEKELEAAKRENELERLRTNTAAARAQRSYVQQFMNSGYGNGGASHTETWSKSYHDESLSPKSDIEENRKTLRQRTRDLAMNAPIGAAAINSTKTSCIGPGLIPKPKIVYEFLGLTADEGKNLSDQIKREFALWAESTQCDTADLNNFYELQQIAFADWLKNGEEFVLIRYEKENENMPYQLRLKLVLADRVSTPGTLDGDYSGYDEKAKNGNRIMNGIEIDQNGKVVAYHISSFFPGEDNFGGKYDWTRVEKRGNRTGNPNILHIFNAETAEQYRGVPFLAPVIKTLKQTTRFSDAELMAAIVNSLFAVFICTDDGNGIDGYGGEDEETTTENGDVHIGTGTVSYLRPGEDVKAIESTHPSNNYAEFMKTMTMQIGAALEVAPEVLMKQFGQNFSASKGALNESWRAFSTRRKWFVRDFCQEIYNLWIAEAVSKGRIKAPGFFSDPIIRKAYCNATWTGPAQGCLNPVQEVNAAIARVKEGFSTHEDECVAMNGSDFGENVRTLKKENESIADAIKAREQQEEKDGKDTD